MELASLGEILTPRAADATRRPRTDRSGDVRAAECHLMPSVRLRNVGIKGYIALCVVKGRVQEGKLTILCLFLSNGL